MEIITALFTYGPLGIISGILLKLYIQERHQSKKDIAELNGRIQEMLERHAEALDSIRTAQTAREKEVSNMLQDYGNSVVNAVEQVHALGERLWGIRK